MIPSSLFARPFRAALLAVQLATGFTALDSRRVPAQQPVSGGTARSLTLGEAVALARQVSPEVQAARDAITGASARERQAGAHPNPTLSYGREQTSARGQTNSQNIA